MPVTAKLSRKFYEKLGDDVANELVEWFNAVDATYRADLRELNELNFARFDAKLEQRLAELDAKWVGRWTELDAKWAGRWTELDAKSAGRWTELDAKLEQRLAELHGKLVAELSTLRGDTSAAIEQAQAATVRWMFTFWAPTAIGIVSTAVAVVALFLSR